MRYKSKCFYVALLNYKIINEIYDPSVCSSVQVLDKVLGTGNVESTNRFCPSH